MHRDFRLLVCLFSPPNPSLSGGMSNACSLISPGRSTPSPSLDRLEQLGIVAHTSAIERQRQKDHEFKTILGYTMPCSKKEEKRNND